MINKTLQVYNINMLYTLY